MSYAVGMIHLQCGFVGKCGGAVYAVDARQYLIQLTNAAIEGNGTFSYPQMPCPACADIDERRRVQAELDLAEASQ